MSKRLLQLISVALLLITLYFGSVLTQSYFNAKEINSLVEGANARGLDYELVITNSWTNAYEFHTK